jgi:sulfatase-like protein
VKPTLSSMATGYAAVKLERSPSRSASRSPQSGRGTKSRSAPTRVARATLSVLVVCIVIGWLALQRPASIVSASATVSARRPNIVLIISDDQRTDMMLAMPHVRRALGVHGVTFTNAFVSNSLCCPSRAAILTGSYSHTNGIYTDVYTASSKFGGWPLFHKTRDERQTVAVALDGAGYRTGLFGKYLNQFKGSGAPPAGAGGMRFSRKATVARTTTTRCSMTGRAGRASSVTGTSRVTIRHR